MRALLLSLAICTSSAIAASNGSNSADTLTTYRNFLGETCLSLDATATDSIAGGMTAGAKQKTACWKQKMTYAAVPLLVTSIAVKNNTEPIIFDRYNPDKPLKDDISDYMPYAPYALIAGMKIAGYEGRSATPRLLTAAILSNAMMAVSAEGIKEGTTSYRPDGTDQRSYVSGHTATSFVAATMLHKEYGRTRSPWFSVAGYGAATATSMMRVMNRRHRAVDILGGAAIGIIATELGYLVTDRIFGSKHIQRLDGSFYDPGRTPSFFDIQMGAGLHTSNLRFTPSAASLPGSSTDTVSIGASAAVAAEGAYFINRYIGFGGMIRLTSTPVSPLNLTADERTQLAEVNATQEKYTYRNPANGTKYPLGGVYTMYTNQGQMTEASVDAGVYASLPLSSRLSIGAKALAGVRLSGSATFTSRNGQLLYDGGETTPEGKKKSYYLFYNANGQIISVSPQNNNMPFYKINPVLKDATEEFDMLRIDASNAVNAVFGINIAWRYHDCFTCKVFADFDTSKTTFKYTRRYFSDTTLLRTAGSALPDEHPEIWRTMNHTERRTLSKRMNHITIGAAFSVIL